jgi:phosphoglycolate phosphatase-like HAD superfamily hydrolase
MIVFDNNGTALDDLHLAYASMCAIFQVLNLRGPTKDQYRNEIGADYMEFYWRHGVPRHFTADDLNPIRKLYYRHRIDTVHYRKDFAALLQECRRVGILTGICTAEIATVLREFLTREKLLEYFQPDLLCADATPSKTTFLVAMAQARGLEPAECAYVDDSEDGIRSSREAGFYAIGFQSPTSYCGAERIHRAKPHAVVSSFDELRRLLPKLINA